MANKARGIILFLIGYMIALGLGFGTGEIYNRMKSKVMIERVQLVEPPQPPQIKRYYVVDISSGGDAFFYEATQNDIAIKLFTNEKLRHLLKLKNIQIYSEDGERLY